MGGKNQKIHGRYPDHQVEQRGKSVNRQVSSRQIFAEEQFETRRKDDNPLPASGDDLLGAGDVVKSFERKR